METITTGRPLDESGTPADGPALELDPDGRAAELFARTPHPLTSSPGLGSWAVRADTPEDNTDTPDLLGWLAPDATELPGHVHTQAPETFRAVEGTFTVVVEGEPRRLDPGESVTVEPGQEHYFRNDTEDYVAFYADLPWKKTLDTQLTVSGLDHEGAFGDPYGEPGFLHGLVMAEELQAETTITVAPKPVQRVLWATVGRVARSMGHRATDERFLQAEYWEQTVEQPEL
jgi:mannose-6-phosphate isomerase-like protein (cupin superfamily)